MDPQNIEAIRNMHFPGTAAELSQFIHCFQWMAACIPDFHCKAQPLMEIFEATYKATGKGKKSALTRIALSNLSWGPIHEVAFQNIKNTLKSTGKLAYPKENHILFILTDA